MADYWKSQPKYYCSTCNSYMADNKVTREKHEQGRRHQENVEKKLKEIRMKTLHDEREQKTMDLCFRKMNEAAAAAASSAAGPQLQNSGGQGLAKEVENRISMETGNASGYKRGDEDCSTADETAAAQMAAAAALAAFNPQDWKESNTADGRKYYWNVKTRETSWEKPQPKLPAAVSADSKPVKSTKIRFLGAAAAKATNAQQKPDHGIVQQTATATPTPTLTASTPSAAAATAGCSSAVQGPSHQFQGPTRPNAPIQGPVRPSALVQGPSRPSVLVQGPSRPSAPVQDSKSSSEAIKDPISSSKSAAVSDSATCAGIIKQEPVESQPISEGATEAEQPINEEAEEKSSLPIKMEAADAGTVTSDSATSCSSSSGLGAWTPVQREEVAQPAAQAEGQRRPKYNFEERTLASGSLKRSSDTQSACTFKKLKQPAAASSCTRISSGD